MALYELQSSTARAQSASIVLWVSVPLLPLHSAIALKTLFLKQALSPWAQLIPKAPNSVAAHWESVDDSGEPISPPA